MSDTTFGEIWKTLSKIDVKDHTKKVNNCTYLSWAWAWGVLMDHYPDATYVFHEPTIFEDGSVEVGCTVQIDGNERYMWLPVMVGYKHAAQINPDARAISDARMRCLVKCLAMFGLGHYIYAGEDIPEALKPEPPKAPKPITKATRAGLISLSEDMPCFSGEGVFTDWIYRLCHCDLDQLAEAAGKKIKTYLADNPSPDSWDEQKREALVLAQQEAAEAGK